MGDLRLSYEDRDGRSLVFAQLPSGQTVWGMDASTREEWWYAPELAHDVLPELRAALAVPQQTAPPPPATGPGVDLALHRPGHAVLAAIETQHRSATSAVIDGMPGTLDEGIVSWCVGYVGESQVGAELERLGPAWRTLHGVPVGIAGSDIDHVVIGPAGVFTVNTKHHPGASVDVKGDGIFVGRDFQPYVRNARTEAGRARTAATGVAARPRIHPLVVMVGARLRVKRGPVDVTVLDSSALLNWLRSQPQTLDSSQVDELYEHLRWSGRWTELLPPAAGAPWVDGFARQMATERAIAKTARRRGLTGGTAAAPSVRSTTSGNRASTSPRRSKASRQRTSMHRDLVRLAVGILLFAFLVTAGPTILRGIASALTPRSGTSGPAAAPGASCTPRGAEAVTPAGAPLVCAPGPGSTKLVWRTPKP